MSDERHCSCPESLSLREERDGLRASLARAQQSLVTAFMERALAHREHQITTSMLRNDVEELVAAAESDAIAEVDRLKALVSHAGDGVAQSDGWRAATEAERDAAQAELLRVRGVLEGTPETSIAISQECFKRFCIIDPMTVGVVLAALRDHVRERQVTPTGNEGEGMLPAEELRARIVQQGRNRLRALAGLDRDEAHFVLASYVDWIETMDRDATVPMGAPGSLPGRRGAHDSAPEGRARPSVDSATLTAASQCYLAPAGEEQEAGTISTPGRRGDGGGEAAVHPAEAISPEREEVVLRIVKDLRRQADDHRKAAVKYVREEDKRMWRTWARHIEMAANAIEGTGYYRCAPFVAAPSPEHHPIGDPLATKEKP